MTEMTTTLVLAGKGGSLSFRDGSGAKRRVLPGVPFEVDADTAAILLGDPNVTPFAEPDRGSARNEPAVPDAPTAADLRARAVALGLTVNSRDTKADLSEAIAAEETRLADEATASSSGEGNQEGGSQPANDPDAQAPGEAGTPPASSTGGVIVLGDIPAGGKVGQ